MRKNEKYSLNRGFSFRYDEKKEMLFVGYNPPVAKSIKDSGGLLRQMVELFQEPKTLGQATYDLSRIHPLGDVALGIEMAMKNNFIVPFKKTSHKKLDRHDLYAQFCQVSEPQEKLLKDKKIAIVGVGGIGSNCAILASSAGIKNLILIDADEIELSNLTRTTLFSESDLGSKKVLAAKKRINDFRKGVRIRTCLKPFQIDHLDFYLNLLKGVDALILSADRAEVHQMALTISQKLGIPYVNSGYAESNGVVGPLVIPGKTSCYNCERLFREGNPIALSEMNPFLQAASFGPLNYMVAGLAVSEILKLFWGMRSALENERWIFNSISLDVTKEKLAIHKKCANHQVTH